MAKIIVAHLGYRKKILITKKRYRLLDTLRKTTTGHYHNIQQKNKKDKTAKKREKQFGGFYFKFKR